MTREQLKSPRVALITENLFIIVSEVDLEKKVAELQQQGWNVEKPYRSSGDHPGKLSLKAKRLVPKDSGTNDQAS